MTLHIRAVPPPAQTRVRQLLLESLPQLLGDGIHALPSTGTLPADTLTVLDGRQQLWLISFSVEAADRAALDGLAAAQTVRGLLPWLTQAGFVPPSVNDCRLLILTHEIPAGAVEFCRRCGSDWRQLRFVEVSGELGLLADPVGTRHPQPAAEARPEPAELKRADSALSPEEEAFFQHL